MFWVFYHELGGKRRSFRKDLSAPQVVVGWSGGGWDKEGRKEEVGGGGGERKVRGEEVGGKVVVGWVVGGGWWVGQEYRSSRYLVRRR